MPGVVEVVADKRELPSLLRRRGLVDVPAGIGRFKGRRRALVKVQDGCRMNCTYCIVPTVRPHPVSRPMEEVLDEVRRLVDNGHHEIVLTGIHLGDYGKGRKRRRIGGRKPELEASALRLPPSALPISLVTLLRRITDLSGDFRVRLSSIEAAEVTPELIQLMAERRGRICPHLHLPLQSGADAVLQRMNRRWPARQFVERCREIRAALDPVALTTDVIVGFPGETEADFAATCRVVEEVGFAKVHVFRFSPREGTPAAVMPRQVTERIAQRRAAEMGEIGRMLRDRYFRGLLGRQLRVLVEKPIAGRPGWMGGISDDHCPVALPGGRELLGQFVSVTAERVEGGWVWGHHCGAGCQSAHFLADWQSAP